MPPLFYSSIDTAKPLKEHFDFVIFYVNGRAFHADCIEFKFKKTECGHDRAPVKGRDMLGEYSKAGC